MTRSEFCLVSIFIAGVSNIDAQSCREVEVLAQMLRVKSVQALSPPNKQAGESYLARLVYSYRLFQIQPRNKGNAELLLKMIPSTQAQQVAVMTIGDMLCSGETLANMTTLSNVYAGLPHELTRAVLLAPSYLPQYVQYSTVAVLDPHSDYAVRMRDVCKKAHVEFIRAVKLLPNESQKAFSQHTLDPSNCKVIALPEAEQ
jgi:hypothetical protein